MEDADFSGLEELFRGRFLETLLQKEKILPETVERFKSWEHSGFNVSFDRKLEPDHRAKLEGLLCYIERVLRHLNRSDPPWKRERRARGPPPGAARGAQRGARGAAPGPTDTVDPAIDDELSSVDPIAPEDA